MKKKRTVFALIVFVFIALFSCNNEADQQTTAAPSNKAAVQIGVAGEATIYEFNQDGYNFIIVSKPGCIAITKKSS